MSAESFLVYYGVRLPIREPEIEKFEWGTHPWLVAAEQHGLDSWWGNFSPEGAEEYYLFVGKQLAMLGAEHESHRSVSDADLRAIAREATPRLKAAGFDAEPSLWTQWQPDF